MDWQLCGGPCWGICHRETKQDMWGGRALSWWLTWRLWRLGRRGLCLQTPLWLRCLCIHPVEGQRPHEFIFETDYCGETERGELVIASESGVLWLAYWRLWWAPRVAVPSRVKESQLVDCKTGSLCDWKGQSLVRRGATQWHESRDLSWALSLLRTSPQILTIKRMGFCWLCQRGSSVMKSVRLSTVVQRGILFPRPEWQSVASRLSHTTPSWSLVIGRRCYRGDELLTFLLSRLVTRWRPTWQSATFYMVLTLFLGWPGLRWLTLLYGGVLGMFISQTQFHLFRGWWVNGWTSRSRLGLSRCSQRKSN